MFCPPGWLCGSVSPWFCRQLSLQLSGVGLLQFSVRVCPLKPRRKQAALLPGLWRSGSPHDLWIVLGVILPFPWRVTPVSSLLSFHLISHFRFFSDSVSAASLISLLETASWCLIKFVLHIHTSSLLRWLWSNTLVFS